MTRGIEPTDRRLALLHHSPTYGPIRVYAPFVGSMSARDDMVIIDGHTLTPAEMARGWYDPEGAMDQR